MLEANWEEQSKIQPHWGKTRCSPVLGDRDGTQNGHRTGRKILCLEPDFLHFVVEGVLISFISLTKYLR